MSSVGRKLPKDLAFICRMSFKRLVHCFREYFSTATGCLFLQTNQDREYINEAICSSFIPTQPAPRLKGLRRFCSAWNEIPEHNMPALQYHGFHPSSKWAFVLPCSSWWQTLSVHPINTAGAWCWWTFANLSWGANHSCREEEQILLYSTS